MATFGATKTAMARRLIDDNNTAVTDVELGEAINEAQQEWKNKRLWFNTLGADITLAADDKTITLPSDFLIDIQRSALSITEGNIPYPVEKISPIRYDSLLNTAATGRPLVYTYRNGVLEISPYADKAYNGRLYYIKDYADFATDTSADGTTNDWLTEGVMVIRNQAIAWIYGELRSDDEREERFTKRANAAYNVLLSRTHALQKTGTLSIEQ